MRHRPLRLFRVLSFGLVLLSFAATLPVFVPVRAQTLSPIRVSVSSADNASSIAAVYGPVHYGSEFGLTMTADSFTHFESSALAVQTVLAGQAEVVAVAFSSEYLLREAGQDFKAFCLRSGTSDNVVVGRHGITKLEQLLDPKTRVGVDSPGGATDLVLTSIFVANGIKATTADLKNTKIFESATARASAIAADQVDATVISLPRVRELQKLAPDAVIIATAYKDAPLLINNIFAAPTKWLDTHQPEATAFCAAVIKAQRAISSDYDLFMAAIKEFVAKPPSDETLREAWELIRDYDLWRLKTGIDLKSTEFNGDILLKAGVIKQKPNYADLLDLRPYEAAIKLLGPYQAPDATAQATDGDATPGK